MVESSLHNIQSGMAVLQEEIIACERCPRLRRHCIEIAEIKRRAFREWTYWGRPVPSFGDPSARLLILGLAPAAHGANRTGRVFTGDRSGDLLYRVLHQNGFASQPESRDRNDGLRLRDAWISAVAHCAPPGNKPAREEIVNCRPFLRRELDLLADIQVVVALGHIAFDSYLSVLQERGAIGSRGQFRFGHNQAHSTGPGHPLLLASYHPSQQNTSTGRLTEAMLSAVFARAASKIHPVFSVV